MYVLFSITCLLFSKTKDVINWLINMLLKSIYLIEAQWLKTRRLFWSINIIIKKINDFNLTLKLINKLNNSYKIIFKKMFTHDLLSKIIAKTIRTKGKKCAVYWMKIVKIINNIIEMHLNRFAFHLCGYWTLNSVIEAKNLSTFYT